MEHWTCRHGLLVTIVAVALLAATSTRAAAQFDTANRQFHNGTAFHLEGKHRTLPCESCHVNGAYRGTPVKCFDCHWVRRQDDRYRLALGSQCEQCHRPTSWQAVTWDHNAMTSMPLGSAHRQLTCQSCHKNNAFANVQLACVSCHLAEFQATKTPNHVAAGFPTACEACHRTSDATFTQARFDHQASFPLVGQHAQITCVSCHRNSIYAGTPRDCVGCHRTEYNRTTTPNHLAAGFPTNCEQCHSPTAASFAGAAFNHNSFFALVGQHAQVSCSACHGTGVYKGTATSCVGCHQADYNRTASPNHLAAGYPTTCDSCHRNSDSTWTQATFSHPFIITSGPHRVSCSSCHTTSGTYTVFNCLTCHNRTEMDGKHRGFAGYQYSSPTCYACHPNGRKPSSP